MPYPTLQEIGLKKIMYSFTVSDKTLKMADEYLSRLRNGQESPGKFLSAILKGVDLRLLAVNDFVRCILNTKQPKNFAEVEIRKASADLEDSALKYNLTELKILADLGTVINSYAFNDGGHGSSFESHKEPLPCVMGFVSAPLLESGAPDLLAVLADNRVSIDQERYNALLENRLFPVLIKMSNEAVSRGETIALTIPGLGCGMFAGEYGQTIRGNLLQFMRVFLAKHVDALPGISSVYLDTFSSGGLPADYKELREVAGKNHKLQFECVASAGTELRKQLTLPEGVGPNVRLGTLVAADLISWIGNDGWIDSRATDEGVKGMSSYVMAQVAMAITSGTYVPSDFQYIPGTGEVNHTKKSWTDIESEITKSEITKGFLKYADPSCSDLFVATLSEKKEQLVVAPAPVLSKPPYLNNSESLLLYTKLGQQTELLRSYIAEHYPKQTQEVVELKKAIDNLFAAVNKEDAKKHQIAIQNAARKIFKDSEAHKHPYIDTCIRVLSLLLSRLAVCLCLKTQSAHSDLRLFSGFTTRQKCISKIGESVNNLSF